MHSCFFQSLELSGVLTSPQTVPLGFQMTPLSPCDWKKQESPLSFSSCCVTILGFSEDIQRHELHHYLRVTNHLIETQSPNTMDSQHGETRMTNLIFLLGKDWYLIPKIRLDWYLIPNGTCTGQGQNKIESGSPKERVLKIPVSLMVHLNDMPQYYTRYTMDIGPSC